LSFVSVLGQREGKAEGVVRKMLKGVVQEFAKKKVGPSFSKTAVGVDIAPKRAFNLWTTRTLKDSGVRERGSRIRREVQRRGGAGKLEDETTWGGFFRNRRERTKASLGGTIK